MRKFKVGDRVTIESLHSVYLITGFWHKTGYYSAVSLPDGVVSKTVHENQMTIANLEPEFKFEVGEEVSYVYTDDSNDNYEVLTSKGVVDSRSYTVEENSGGKTLSRTMYCIKTDSGAGSKTFRHLSEVVLKKTLKLPGIGETWKPLGNNTDYYNILDVTENYVVYELQNPNPRGLSMKLSEFIKSYELVLANSK